MMVDDQENPEKMFACPMCGSDVGEFATVCPGCGTAFEDGEDFPPPSDLEDERASPPSKSKGELVIREHKGPTLAMEKEQMSIPSDTKKSQAPPPPWLKYKETSQPSMRFEMPPPSDLSREDTFPSDVTQNQPPPSDISDKGSSSSDLNHEQISSPEINRGNTSNPDMGRNKRLASEKQVMGALKDYTDKRRKRYFMGTMALGLGIVLFVLLWLVVVYDVLVMESNSWFGVDIILLLVFAGILFILGLYLILTYPKSTLEDFMISMSKT
jgi:hypothetical protein